MSVTPPTYVGEMTNLSLEQHAGSRDGRFDVPSYISGYFDGEGCFSVSISPRPQLSVGWEVRPSVSVSQNEDRRQVVDMIHAYFACGSIRRDRSDLTIKWEVRNLSKIVESVLPHFRRWPLVSAKQSDVELLERICEHMRMGRHREPHGLMVVAGLAASMNPSGIRRYSLDDIERSFSR
ncbi:MAG: LAGLIDADG family homing endonuclease [Marinobacter sp.]|uniref:LAGLIDADG family homing endonuclease n=1 Tax=Marinobacter sp. TaxID=50741 RepID=UPI0034A3B30C